MASCLLVSDTSTELSYILPSEAAKKGAFERLFQVWGGAGWGLGVGGRGPEGRGPMQGGGRGVGTRRRGQPLSQRSLSALPQHLERSLDTLHLSSFGLMDTTLEEVFLKVSEEDQSLENSEAGGSPRSSCRSVLRPAHLSSGLRWPPALTLSLGTKDSGWEQGARVPCQAGFGAEGPGRWVAMGIGAPQGEVG